MSAVIPDLDALLAFSIALAKEAGARIKEGSAKRFESGAGFDEKKNSVDLVTETDQAVEKLVKERIAGAYPDHKFMGEESWAAGEESELTDDPTWIVDPIDGTTNFVHGFPYCAISIGLTYQKRPALGVIYNPFLDELYSAIENKGAYLNERHRLPLTAPAPPLRDLSDALLGVEWGADRTERTLPLKLRSFERLVAEPKKGGRMAHGLRSLGAASLNYCMVARGGLDAYWEIGCWQWDVCAGIVIVQESGGKVYGAQGTPLTGEVDASLLLGRKYLCVRAIGDTADEKGVDASKRIAKEFYETVQEWEA